MLLSTALATHIKKYTSLTPEEESILQSCTHTLRIKKKDFLLKEGQVCKANYFIEKGCLRLLFVDGRGAKQTVQFGIENWWLSDYSSLGNQTASQFYIQAVEDTVVVVFEQSAQEAAFAELPQLERYFRKVLEKAYGAAQWRIKYIFSLSKEEMYKQFITSYPDFVQRVPQYMLASFLGFTPEYLSEIRKKKY